MKYNVIFDIRDYVGEQLEILKESATQWKVKCPSCGEKLIVNKQNPKYFCPVNNCHEGANSVRQALGVPSFQSSSPRISIPVKSLTLPSNFKVLTNLDKPNTITKITKNLIENKKLITTTYDYGDNYKVVRYDIYINNKRVDKEFRPYIGDTLTKYQELPLYGENLFSSYGVYIWAEGEKCVDYIMSNGYKAFTTSGGMSCNEGYILSRLSLNLDKLKGVVLIPDYDKAGEKKAKLMEECLWKCGIPTKKIDITRYSDYLKDGEDIVDLLELGIDLKEVIYG